MATGYIKLYRSSLNDPLYMKEPFTKWQAWCDLILLAYFAPNEFFVRGIKVKAKRGCVYKGVIELAERWQWSRGKVERFISFLEADKRVSVQKSNVISCISIINYEKYQQNDTALDVSSDLSGSNNENQQNCDNVLIQEQAEMFSQFQKELSELKERLDAQDQAVEKQSDKKPTKKKTPNPLITKGRKIFEKRYSDLFDGGVYYWQAKDAAAMDALTKKIIHSRKQKGMSIEEADVLDGLKAFFNSITDQWVLKNFSVTSINGKYNEIVAQARAALNTKSNGTDIRPSSQDKRRGSEVTATKAEDYEGSF